ncbi:MAG TPA: tRNA pseudouridine(13) synthase TruD [Phycisphaerae bacterium]|jgi:tRNA pseudouridine13 synthase|nr:tRNA pseudouridine(13) synthase TruD [Phycisphaerae bacterium]
MQLPPPTYLTAELPGIGGKIKQHLEDFQVEEVPLYEAKGVGTHCYLKIEKRGFSTMAAADILAKALGRKNKDIGYAGLKDKQAITRQWFSVEHLDTARAKAMELPKGMKVVEISRHNNKIKRGHLAGNKFVVKVRNEEWGRVGVGMSEASRRAQAILDVLMKDGVPNFFGPQRFGMRRDNHMLGLALLKGDHQAFIDRFLGDPDESVDHGMVLQARHKYAKKDYAGAIELWPGHMRDERRALAAMQKGNAKRAAFAVDLELKKLMVSALQSFLFNRVLERRVKKMGVVMPGDFCFKHENGASFLVGETIEEAQKEQPRADAHEISPTGPLFGFRMSEAKSVAGQMEAEVLAESGLKAENFDGPMGAPGGRRPLRFFAQEMRVEAGSDENGMFLEFEFMLPSGSYATVLLGEVMKEEVTLD